MSRSTRIQSVLVKLSMLINEESYRQGQVQDDLGSEKMVEMLLAIELRTSGDRKKVLWGKSDFEARSGRH